MSDKELKAYALFEMTCYYPGGGLNDLTGFFDTLEEAISAGEKYMVKGMIEFDWYEVIDTKTWEKVADSSQKKET